MHFLFAFILSNILLLFTTVAKGNGLMANSDTLSTRCIQQASQRLDEVFTLMQRSYYKKDDVKWDTLITSAKARLLAAGTCEDAYQTVNWCFTQLKEKHSFVMPVERAAVYQNDTARLRRRIHISQLMGELKGEVIPGKEIAYLTVPWISTTDSAICTMIADSLQKIIAGLDGNGISKWIIDLRKNTGGNCWPMLAGIGPLLDNGTCGYFVTGNEKVPISYRNGAALHGRHVRCRVSTSGYRMKQVKNRIVLLTGPQTSSSGEIVAIAFKGQDQALFYGEPTAGFTTANATYTLSDQSMLVLTVCLEADRNGKVYEGKIVPDQIIPSGEDTRTDDAAKSAAIMWLHIQ